ncbi:MAG: hypothetical protein HRT35_33190 [Algicola sp.]|nr:hypothetical protein [Algicola sp.]
MTQAKLPTKEQLQTLFELKGREALVWYAWRNAMRALPALGQQPITTVWSEKPVYRVFSVLRANVFTFVCGLSLLRNIDKIVAANVCDVATISVDATGNTADAANGVHASAYAANAAHVADAPAYADATGYATVAAYSGTNALTFAAIYAAAAVDAKAAVYADYQYLMTRQTQLLDIWKEPLWWDNKPPLVIELERAFIENLNNNGLDFLADDIKKFWAGENPGDHLLNYLKNVSESELQTPKDIRKLIHGYAVDDNYAVRAILIGPGGAGKTSLFELLTEGETTKGTAPTEGVNYHNHTPVNFTQHVNEAEQHKYILDLYLWDFGGQAIFHSLHNAFMHENCVYILVVDSRHEQAPDEWLAQIASVTGNQGKVIVVTNWFDGIESQQNRRGLIRKFPNLLDEGSFHDFCCQTTDSTGFKGFINQLIDTCINSQRLVFSDTRHAMDLVKAQYEKQNFITEDQLLELLEQNIAGLTDEQAERLSGKLKEFGRYVSVDCNDQQLCLKPEWIISKTYQLIYDKQVRLKKGIVTYREIKAALKRINKKDKTPMPIDELADKISDFMINQSVCIKLNKKGPRSSKRFFLPDAVTTNEPEQLSDLLGQSTPIVLAYEMAFFPIGHRSKLVSEFYNNSQITFDELNGVWRDGMIVHLKDTNDCLVLEYQPRLQRIQLSLIGEEKGLATLLDIADATLEALTGREVIGYPIYEKNIKGLFNKSELLIDQDGQQAKMSIVNNYSNCHIHTKGDHKVGDINVQNSNINKSAIGDGATNMSHNTTNTTQTINADQKAWMAQVINQAIVAAMSHNNHEHAFTTLVAAKTELASVEDQLPQSNEPEVNSVLDKVWTGMKEVNTAGTMMKNANEYITPLVASVLTLLGLG